MVDVRKLVEQVPDVPRNSKFSNVPEGKIEEIVAELLKGGKEAVAELIRMTRIIVAEQDWKQRYLLHCIAVEVGKPDRKDLRKMVAETMAEALSLDRPPAVKEFLCQELQVCGAAEQAPALGALLGPHDLTEPAAQALLAIGEGAAEQFRAALPKAKEGPKLTILQALAVLKDRESVEEFKKALGDPNREIRMAAAFGLANAADPGSVDLVLKAADAKGWERIRATDFCLRMAENLAKAGNKAEAKKIYAHLKETRTDASEKYILEAVEAALSKTS